MKIIDGLVCLAYPASNEDSLVIFSKNNNSADQDQLHSGRFGCSSVETFSTLAEANAAGEQIISSFKEFDSFTIKQLRLEIAETNKEANGLKASGPWIAIGNYYPPGLTMTCWLLAGPIIPGCSYAWEGVPIMENGLVPFTDWRNLWHVAGEIQRQHDNARTVIASFRLTDP